MQIEFELPGIDPEEFNRPLGDITIPEIVSMHSGMRLTSLLSQSAFSRVTIGVRARGAGGLQPPDSGKTIIFRAKAKFFAQKPAAKK